MRIKIMMLLAVLFLGVQTANAREKPDIQEVVSVTVDPLPCGITDAVMTYKDSHGQQQTYSYKTWNYNCNQQQ
jgi:hypothetical protein